MYCRKGRLLLALRSVLRAQRLSSDDAKGGCDAHVVAVRFLRDAAAALARSGDGAALPAPVATVLREGVAEVLGGAASAAAFNDAFLAAAAKAAGGQAPAAAQAAHAAAQALLA